MKKIFLASILGLVLTGCMNSPLAFRSIVYMNQQTVTTDGKLETAPTFGSANVEAPKTTEDSFKPTTAKSVTAGQEVSATNDNTSTVNP